VHDAGSTQDSFVPKVDLRDIDLVLPPKVDMRLGDSGEFILSSVLWQGGDRSSAFGQIFHGSISMHLQFQLDPSGPVWKNWFQPHFEDTEKILRLAQQHRARLLLGPSQPLKTITQNSTNIGKSLVKMSLTQAASSHMPEENFLAWNLHFKDVDKDGRNLGHILVIGEDEGQARLGHVCGLYHFQPCFH